jgi:hypothetical protein
LDDSLIIFVDIFDISLDSFVLSIDPLDVSEGIIKEFDGAFVLSVDIFVESIRMLSLDVLVVSESLFNEDESVGIYDISVV